MVTPFEKSYPRSLQEMQEYRDREVTINLLPKKSALADIVTDTAKKNRDA